MTERNWVLVGRDSSAKPPQSLLKQQFLLHSPSPSASDRLSSINRLNHRINDRINSRDSLAKSNTVPSNDIRPPVFRITSASAFERNSTTASFIDSEDSSFRQRANRLVDESFQFIDSELSNGGPVRPNGGDHPDDETNSSSSSQDASSNASHINQRHIQQRDSNGDVCAVFERRAEPTSLQRSNRVKFNVKRHATEVDLSRISELPPSEEAFRSDYFTYGINEERPSLLPRDSVYYDKCDVCCTNDPTSTGTTVEDPVYDICRVCSTFPNNSRFPFRLNPVYEEEDVSETSSRPSAHKRTSDMNDNRQQWPTVIRRPGVTIEPYYGPQSTTVHHLSVGDLAKGSNYSDVTTASPSPTTLTNGLVTSEVYGNGTLVRIHDNELRVIEDLTNKERTRRNLARNRRVLIVVLCVICVLVLVGTGIVLAVKFD